MNTIKLRSMKKSPQKVTVRRLTQIVAIKSMFNIQETLKDSQI